MPKLCFPPGPLFLYHISFSHSSIFIITKYVCLQIYSILAKHIKLPLDSILKPRKWPVYFFNYEIKDCLVGWCVVFFLCPTLSQMVYASHERTSCRQVVTGLDTDTCTVVVHMQLNESYLIRLGENVPAFITLL